MDVIKVYEIEKKCLVYYNLVIEIVPLLGNVIKGLLQPMVKRW